MLAKHYPYNTGIPEISALQNIKANEVTMHLQDYLAGYKDCFVRSQQIRYFEAFEKGLLNSNLDRKSIEPIALSFFK